MLGTDGKILRTRSGAPVRLMALLDEAVERAAAVVAGQPARARTTPRARDIAHEVGIGAVKYADLSIAHDTEYVFDFDRMLALQRQHRPLPAVRRRRGSGRCSARPGTAPEAARTGAGRPRRAGRAGAGPGTAGVRGRRGAGRTTPLEPHRLCTYLFDLAQAFTAFYEQCPILQAEDPGVRASRQALSATTLAVMVRGLDLLGILAPEEM